MRAATASNILDWVALVRMASVLLLPACRGRPRPGESERAEPWRGAPPARGAGGATCPATPRSAAPRCRPGGRPGLAQGLRAPGPAGAPPIGQPGLTASHVSLAAPARSGTTPPRESTHGSSSAEILHASRRARFFAHRRKCASSPCRRYTCKQCATRMSYTFKGVQTIKA